MEHNTGGHPVHSAKILTIQQGVSSIGNPRQALHSNKEIIVMMWIFHIERQWSWWMVPLRLCPIQIPNVPFILFYSQDHFTKYWSFVFRMEPLVHVKQNILVNSLWGCCYWIGFRPRGGPMSEIITKVMFCMTVFLWIQMWQTSCKSTD